MAQPTPRQTHHLFIDEFQSFTTESFGMILSEARKFGLTLTIGHQYVDQIAPLYKLPSLEMWAALSRFGMGVATRCAWLKNAATSRRRVLPICVAVRL